ncbi:hypothetical protein ACQ4PT_057620 [Festuca glaucescens]
MDWEAEDVDEERMIQPSDLQSDFHELVKSMDACKLDCLHKKKVQALMVYVHKRKRRVPSRFCSFHLAGFDLDEESTVELGPQYEPFCLPSGTRVVGVGPDCSYPVQVYGKVIARDEIDYKCVYLLNRERKDAQTIKSKVGLN